MAVVARGGGSGVIDGEAGTDEDEEEKKNDGPDRWCGQCSHGV